MFVAVPSLTFFLYCVSNEMCATKGDEASIRGEEKEKDSRWMTRN